MAMPRHRNQRILPAGMTFERALRAGYLGRLRHQEYLAWIRTLPCDGCNRPGPSDASHPNTLKGMGTKSADCLAIPECRECHEAYEASGSPCAQARLARAALYLLRAIWEGRLTWRKL